MAPESGSGSGSAIASERSVAHDSLRPSGALGFAFTESFRPATGTSAALADVAQIDNTTSLT